MSGQRILHRTALTAHLKELRAASRGAEFLINDLHKKKRITHVRLPHVFIFGKMEKQPLPEALQDYVKEAREFLVQVMKIQSNDLNPYAKRALRTAQTHINKALDYLRFP